MKWIWVPAAVAAAVAAFLWIERADRAPADRAGERDAATARQSGATGPAGDPAADTEDATCADAGGPGCDYVVAGRVVDGAGRPVPGASVHLRVGSG